MTVQQTLGVLLLLVALQQFAEVEQCLCYGLMIGCCFEMEQLIGLKLKSGLELVRVEVIEEYCRIKLEQLQSAGEGNR